MILETAFQIVSIKLQLNFHVYHLHACLFLVSKTIVEKRLNYPIRKPSTNLKDFFLNKTSISKCDFYASLVSVIGLMFTTSFCDIILCMG